MGCTMGMGVDSCSARVKTDFFFCQVLFALSGCATDYVLMINGALQCSKCRLVCFPLFYFLPYMFLRVEVEKDIEMKELTNLTINDNIACLFMGKSYTGNTANYKYCNVEYKVLKIDKQVKE
jgi:hypothetical protein